MTQKVEIHLKINAADWVSGGLEAELVVDGEVLSAFDYGPLDLGELELSTQGDGTHFLWTCECGFAGCAGRFKGVVVRHRGGEVEWCDRDMERTYSFCTDELRQSLVRALAEGQRLLAERPAVEIIPDQNREYFRVRHPA
ncbi:MAG TPA: hypothetical protein VN699_12885 [Pirellulales bacterium]|nr:hypothetical protein [Pirellulales bacterium]